MTVPRLVVNLFSTPSRIGGEGPEGGGYGHRQLGGGVEGVAGGGEVGGVEGGGGGADGGGEGDDEGGGADDGGEGDDDAPTERMPPEPICTVPPVSTVTKELELEPVSSERRRSCPSE